MTNFNYVTYTCTVCKRSKDYPRDDLRALPSSCSITKACTGTLYKTGEKLTASSTPGQVGVRDWYPRGQVPVANPGVKTTPTTSLASAADGTMFLAVLSDNPEDQVVLNVTQATPADIQFQQYLFVPDAPQTILSGKDVQGKTLRFDLTAINDGRVAVRVNGLQRVVGSGPNDIVLTPNTVSFNEPVEYGANIDVSVYLTKNSQNLNIVFAPNGLNAIGAWGNIRWFNRYDQAGQILPGKWWVYNSRIAIKASSTLKLNSIDDGDGTPIYSGAQLANAIFLMASEPFGNIDRYNNFFVSCDKLSGGFDINAVKDKTAYFSVANELITETYPPIPLSDLIISETSSFISKDIVAAGQTGVINSDTTAVRRPGKKIIGPV